MNKLVVLLVSLVALGACQNIQKEASYPTKRPGSDRIIYSDEKRDTIWGEGTSFGDFLTGRDRESQAAAASGIGVNSFLWRATLDTLSFMPISQADPFGGVVLTDWYENPEAPGERFKVNVYILDRQLRADGLRVAVFKQIKNESGWQDAKVAQQVALDLETSILTRARDLRVATSSIGRH